MIKGKRGIQVLTHASVTCKCINMYKPGQYLDYKKCVCKNKLIGRVIAECTSVINETMMNNKKQI